MLPYCPHKRSESLGRSLYTSNRRMEMAHHNVSYRETYRDADPERNQQQLKWARHQLVVSDSHMPHHRKDVALFCQENPNHLNVHSLMSELGRLEFMLQETHRLITHWITDTPDTHTHRTAFWGTSGIKQRQRLEALDDVL